MGSKSNFSLAQVKEILGGHKNTLMKFFNTTIERLERKVDRQSENRERSFKERNGRFEIFNGVCLIHLTKSFLKLTQRCNKSTVLLMNI